jgi:hypothetical protein
MTHPTCRPLSDGRVEIGGAGVLTPYEAAMLIVEIASATTQAHRRSGEQAPDRTETEAPVSYIETTAMGLSPAPNKDYVLLSLHFGAAEVGIAIAKSDGIQLGQALTAACSDESTAH